MIARTREHMSALRHGTPGRRFQDLHARHRQCERAHPWRWAFIALAVLALLVGVAISLPPALSGVWLWGPALVFLAAELAWVARLLDRAELLGRRALRRVWPWRRREPHAGAPAGSSGASTSRS